MIKNLEKISPKGLKRIEANQLHLLRAMRLKEIIYRRSFSEEALSETTLGTDTIDRGTLSVCILISAYYDRVVAKGLTARSPKDQMYRLYARILARDRALQALDAKSNSEPIKDKNNGNAALLAALPWKFKSLYQPELTEEEKQLVAKVAASAEK